MNVSEFIIKELEKLKILNTCIVSGGGMMFLMEALKNSKIKCYFNHNEQCSAYAAEAMSRFSNSPSVCFATSGPGSTNIISGVVSAFQESAPVLFITGQSKSTQTISATGIKSLRQYGTFEVDSVKITSNITKYSKLIKNPNDIKYELEKALYLSTQNRPGPVHLDLPLDIQSSIINPKKLRGYSPINKKESRSKIKSNLKNVIKIINNHKKPLILLGQGCRDKKIKNLFEKLIKHINIPVVTTHIGKDVLFYDHKNFIGHPGPKGDRAGNLSVCNADCILVLGSSLHSQTIGWNEKEFAKNAFKIQVDPDKSILKKTKKITNLQINMDTLTFLKEFIILKATLKNFDNSWLKSNLLSKKKYRVCDEPHVNKKNSINYYKFIDLLSEYSLPKTTFVSGSGLGWYVTGQGLKLKRNQSFISSGSLGAMGYELPAANGVSLINKFQTICVLGDGSLMTNLHDLSVTKNAKKNIKIFVYNNKGYTSIRNTQKNFFKKPFMGTDEITGIQICDIKKISKLFNIKYEIIKDQKDMIFKIKKILNFNKPMIIEVQGIKNQEIIPTVFTKKTKFGEMISTNLDEMYPVLK